MIWALDFSRIEGKMYCDDFFLEEGGVSLSALAEEFLVFFRCIHIRILSKISKNSIIFLSCSAVFKSFFYVKDVHEGGRLNLFSIKYQVLITNDDLSAILTKQF